MDDFLTAVSTTKVKQDEAKSLTRNIQPPSKTISSEIDSPGAGLAALKDQPNFDTVSSVLRYLASEADKKDGFNLTSPDPVAANIAFQLVNSLVPNYWSTLKECPVQAKQLVRCLRNPCGLGSILTRLRPLIADCRLKKAADNTRDASSYVTELLDVLERVLRGDQCISSVWADVQKCAKNAVQAKMMWKEFLLQVASGKILALVAEGEDVLKEKGASPPANWLADGNEYATWLGRNVANLIKSVQKKDESTGAIVDICGKALTLGYTDRVIGSLISAAIRLDLIENFAVVLNKLKSFEQKKYLSAVVTFLTNRYLASEVEIKDDTSIKPSKMVPAVAALIQRLVKDNESLKDALVTALTKSSIPALDSSLSARRSVVAAIAQDEDQLHNVLETGLKLFGDTFYIKHTPILQQEGLAQTLAVVCGYIQRSQPMFLTIMAKSSYHSSGMSNRIGSSSTRARFLGIAVGMAISKLVDKPEMQLKFDLEGDEALEAKWYQRLTEVNDGIGRFQDLIAEGSTSTATTQNLKTESLNRQSAKNIIPTKPSITEIQGPRIVEILDESEADEDDDLVPYEKPDSDPEDDTDDPTEINRNKPVPPVYVRDLIAGLRDQENYDRHALALSTAPSLIRRKANFGTEVIDHIEELAAILVGLQDTYDLDRFAENRQQALIAILLAKPAAMAQWFVRAFFSGDYSLTQRTAILTTLGLGARELAGLRDAATEDLVPPSPSFPSKQLPPHLHALYSGSSSDHLGRITSGVSKAILSPLAAQAADALTGPSVLKVRTFSSRMEVEARRSKPIPNALAQIVADNFFFPLTGRWWVATRSSSSSDSVYTSPLLLPALLQTLALLLQASGPSTLALPQMTRELWALLLSLRGAALDDKRVLSALLFALLMLLETNADKERLATEQGKELIETQEWVKMVFENLPAGKEGGDEERVRVLAAGVVVRCQEVVEKYQRRLVGSLMDY